MTDTLEHAYDHPAPNGRLVHHYGPNVHILSDPWALGVLGRLCSPSTHPPILHDLVIACYRRLFNAVAAEQLPSAIRHVPTRMAANEPRAVATGSALDPTHQVVVVDVMRAGILPSQVLQRELLCVMDPERVRVDHLLMQRVTDAVTGHVSGVDLLGAKIGGSVDGATVLIPDPMGATGGSIHDVIAHYRAHVGEPRAIVCLHLIVTPEYLKRVTALGPTVQIYALRVDRGLSTPDVLAAVPGERWAEERGLDPHDYIVPGAGGVGELIYNAFV